MGESVTQAMLLIKSVAPGAHLALSEWTCKWYVDAGVEVSNGVTLTGITEHEPTPDRAVLAFLDRLKAVDTADLDHVLVVGAFDDRRRHYRWNGAAFVHEPTDRFAPSGAGL